ncbi:MAG: SRPBCC domain-containing protein [Candidatus Aminicenantes bacterium]|nr:MAG: SRPBCC domain-containing protein [Candidatus Aminicenantes bacterium]
MSENLIINRSIIKEVSIPASIDEAWNAWTTKQGLESFFAPECHIELELWGRYEIFFVPDAEKGNKGAEDNKILAVEPNKMFSFTWDAPATMPEVRKQRTSVVLKFEKLGEDKTRIVMCHTGWGEGDEWDRAFDYFTDAWDAVLKRLGIRFVDGPIDWTKTDFPTKKD